MTDEQFWRLQGRLNAMEIVILSDVYNMAKTQPNPFQWIQDFVQALAITSKTLMPDAMSSTEGDRLKAETKAALDEFMATVISHAGQLKGAPGNS